MEKIYNKLYRCIRRTIFSGMAFLPFIPLLSFGDVTITASPGATINFAEDVAVGASITDYVGLEAVELWFYTNGMDRATICGNHIALTNDVSSSSPGLYKYSGLFPFLPVGNYTWEIKAKRLDGTYESSSLQNISVTEEMSYARHHTGKRYNARSENALYTRNKSGWSNVSTISGGRYLSAEAPNGSLWIANQCGWAEDNDGAKHLPKISGTYMLADASGGMSYPLIYMYNLPPGDLPYIRSPRLDGGMGEISFTANLLVHNGSTIQIQVCRDEDGLESSVWETISSVTLQRTVPERIIAKCNDASVKYVRIFRSSNNYGDSEVNGLIAIHDIRISRPTSDVVIGEKLFNPGYPSINKDVQVFCSVANMDRWTPAYGRELSLYYNISSEKVSQVQNWAVTNMTLLRTEGDKEIYTATIPATAASHTGFMHYYFNCKFKGHYLTPDQQLKEAYFNYGGTVRTAPAPTSVNHCTYEIRPFVSRYRAMFLKQTETGEEEKSYPMNLVGDNTWQITAPVTGGKDVGAFICGMDGYITGAEHYEAFQYIYGDRDQGEPFETPTGGIPERELETIHDGTILPLRIEAPKEGYLLYRIIDAPEAQDHELSYVIKRGIYQDFNDWESDPQYYNETVYGASIGETTEDFGNWVSSTGWGANDDARENFLYQDQTTSFNSIESETINHWYATGFKYTSDRITNAVISVSAENTIYSNTTVRLSAAGGRLRNTGKDPKSMPNGVGDLIVKARSTIDDDDIAFYETKNWTPGGSTSTYLMMETTFDIPLEYRTKSHYYVSFVYNYQNKDNYQEVRYVRGDSNNTATNSNVDGRIVYEHWERINGEERRLGSWPAGYRNQIHLDTTIKMRVRCRTNTATDKKIRTESDLTIGDWVVWNNYNAGSTEPTATTMWEGGKIGFKAFDCVPVIHSLKIFENGSATPSYQTDATTGFTPSKNNWNLGSVDLSRPQPAGQPALHKWSINDNGKLTRSVPINTINVYTAPYNGSEEPPIAGAYKFRESFVVDSLDYTTKTLPIHSYEPLFIDLRISESPGDIKDPDGAVAIDEIRATSWRATSRTMDAKHGHVLRNAEEINAYKWDSTEDQRIFLNGNEDKWIILEGWAVTNYLSQPQSVGARFQRSQANTNLVQGIVSPIMTNGLGRLKFNYVVSGAFSTNKVVYAIEYTDINDIDDYPGENSVMFTNYVGNTGSFTHEIKKIYSQPGEEEIAMRLRIRILEGTDPDVVFWIDNLYLSDSPNESDDMWKVYNGFITSNGQGDNTRIFEGKSLFLNDSSTEGIHPSIGPGGLNEHHPYIQTPRMEEGIGEISFVYRAYTPSKPAYLAIDLAEDELLGDDQWFNLTNIVVSDTGYVKLSDPTIYQKRYKFLRIRTLENVENGRLAIDNILITEPSRSSFAIPSVWLEPLQPIVSNDKVAVFAKIGKEMQKPQGIRLFASYVVGTDNWGYLNWFNSAKENAIELHRIDNSSIFTTAEGEGLPASPANGTIQYVVWGLHDAIPASYEIEDVIFQGENSFTNPAWYGSVDLNKTYESSGFSPYYLIYSCPPGSVWVNEISAMRNGTETMEGSTPFKEYVELAGVSGTDISGWKINFYANSTTKKNSVTIPQGTTIPNSGSGIGFYVIGDPGTLPEEATNYYVVDESKAGNTSLWGTTTGTAGVEVLRDGGIIEERVVVARLASGCNNLKAMNFRPFILWKTSSEAGNTYSLTDVPCEGREDEDLATTNSVIKIDGNPKIYYWNFGSPTPGAPNKNIDGVIAQTFGPNLSHTLISMINNSTYGAYNGTQNGDVTRIEVSVAPGSEGEQIVYLANSWYKIVSLTANGTPIADAQNKATYTFEGSSMTTDTTLEVTFGPKTSTDYAGESDPAKRWSDELLAWFRQNGWTEMEIAEGDDDGLSIEEEYLLATNPLIPTELENVISNISIDGTTATLTTKLVRTENGINVSSTINGSLKILGSSDLSSSFQPIPGAERQSAFNGTEEENISIDYSTLNLRFFKFVIE